MNYLSRLSKQIKSYSSGNLISRLQRIWSTLEKGIMRKSITDLSHLRESLCEMGDILIEEANESLKEEDKVCEHYFCSVNVMSKLFGMAQDDKVPGILEEVIKFYILLVDNLPGEFLNHAAVHESLLRLMNRSLEPSPSPFKKYEEQLIELSFAICTKLTARNFRFFFDSQTWSFSLFKFLLRFVHLNGKMGDYARTSILLMLEIKNQKLMHYIVEKSDFPTILSIALGASFSELPRSTQTKFFDFILKDEEMTSPVHADLPSPPASPVVEVDFDLLSFLHLLDFSQNCILKSKSFYFGKSIAFAVYANFLSNILGPSILFSTEGDRSTQTILFYVECMLRILHEPILSGVFVLFLLNSKETKLHARHTEGSGKIYSQHKSVHDFLISKLESQNEEMNVILLKLFSATFALHREHFVNSFEFNATFCPLDCQIGQERVQLKSLKYSKQLVRSFRRLSLRKWDEQDVDDQILSVLQAQNESVCEKLQKRQYSIWTYNLQPISPPVSPTSLPSSPFSSSLSSSRIMSPSSLFKKSGKIASPMHEEICTLIFQSPQTTISLAIIDKIIGKIATFWHSSCRYNLLVMDCILKMMQGSGNQVDSNDGAICLYIASKLLPLIEELAMEENCIDLEEARERKRKRLLGDSNVKEGVEKHLDFQDFILDCMATIQVTTTQPSFHFDRTQ